MEVVAVSRSEPRWLDINGARVSTSIIHEPASAIILTSNGVETNTLAVHNAPVYVFFQHHYDYWRSQLGLPKTTWDWCHWGENITMRTDPYLDENDIHLGDIWKIGADVLLQVCGARVPCFKLSWRCGQNDSWLMDVAKTGFCGVYMKVLRAGVLRPGDKGMITTKGSGQVSVATITRLAFEQSLKTKDTIDLLVRDPNLLSMNKLLFLAKLSMLHDQELLRKNHWDGWRAFRPARIVDECENVKSFYLEPVDGKPLGTYLPGQFATVRLPHGKIKTWTISDYPDQHCARHYRVTIKKTSEDGGSGWMHMKCTASTKLFLRAPAGAFHIDWSSLTPGRQVYISGGIGITPMLAMLKAHFKHYTMTKAPAIWVHVGREAGSVPWDLVEEVLNVHNEDPEGKAMFRTHIFLTSPGDRAYASTMMCPNSIGNKVSIASGRPSSSFFSTLLSPSYTIDPLKITPIEIPGHMSTFYICGSEPFEHTMKTELQNLGVAEALIRSESFSAGVSSSGSTAVSKAAVTFLPARVTAEWVATTPADAVGQQEQRRQSQSLLELAESAGLQPAFGCRAGVCGACKVRLAKGSVSGGLQADGGVLICSARPASEIVEIEM